MTADAKERVLQDDIIREMLGGGWVQGEPGKSDREPGRDPEAHTPSFW